MNFMKRFVSGLGAQAAPFGFGLDNPDTQYRAGLSFIGDVGANMLANNQGGVSPWQNLGESMQQAKAGSLVRNRQAMAAQQMMQEAEDNRRKREEEAAAKKQREDWISTLPPEQQGLARLFPEKFGAELIAEQFPDPVDSSNRYKVVGNQLYDTENRQWVEGVGGMGQGDLPKGYRWKEDGSGAEPIPGVTVPGAPKPYTPGSSDRNAIRNAQSENAMLRQTLTSLDEADTLVKNANTGFLSTGRATVAENLPDQIVPDMIFGTPKQGADTLRLKQIMDAEALASMGKLLKGPTSDRDVRIMLETVNDPNASPERKQASIDQVRRIIEAQIAANDDLINWSLNGPDAQQSAPITTEDGYTIEQVGE